MDSPSPPELAAELPGGCYALQAQLGSGATSDVWRACADDGSSVVVKLGKAAEQATALAGEALVASLALSPRLPALIALGTGIVDHGQLRPAASGRPFVVFHDGQGQTLDPSPATGDVSLALCVARDVADALADLHGVGLAHGDVKPANVTLANGRAGLIDLGLAGPAHRTEVVGGTPRYLARGDRNLGDARARDLLALGLLIAEIASPEIASSDRPLEVARRAELDPRVAAICAALLAPEPGARPSARWVHDRASSALDSTSPDVGRHARRVRAHYLRLRRRVLGRAASVGRHTAPWATESLRHHHAARSMCKAAGVAPPPPLAAHPDAELAPLTLDERWRWLVGLVGRAATSWPADLVSVPDEAPLALALERLALVVRPETWTLQDIECALANETPAPTPTVATLDVTNVAELMRRVCGTPPDRSAIDIIEENAATAPVPLTLAAADALRLSGELGRARGLIAAFTTGAGLDVVADIMRRCGDTERAVELAEQAMANGSDPHGRARACCARIHYDEGDYDRALTLVGGRPNHAATAEVAALVKTARGHRAEGLALARRGYALAGDAEHRARLSATIAFIQRGANAVEARRRYQMAADHAVQAGAVLEEASYRTGEASASVEIGDLDAAVAAAERATLLFEEVLDRPAASARAWLARAGALAAIDAKHEAIHAAEQAIAHASDSGDRRAEGYAWWAIAAVSDAGSKEGMHAAKTAHERVGDHDDDDIQAAAHLLRHAPSEISDERRSQLDDRCRHAATRTASTEARLTWWGARALDLLSSHAHELPDGRAIVSELCALADADAPVEASGRAMFAGTLLAAALSETDALARLESARAERAARVREGTRASLKEAARGCRWVVGRGSAPRLDANQAIDLRQLVLALSERDNLQTLLDRVLDVLIMWTGAERGLLLMAKPDATLVPRAARNLSRMDLENEQLLVSTSLAERALSSGEPVMAIDAMEELSSSYDSVHALKLRSVLALPLIAHGERLGVVYLDDRLRRGAFGEKELAWAQSVAPVAALAIADARAQVELRRAVENAERATRKLEASLAHKETALDVAERELERSLHIEASRPRHEGIVGESEAMKQLLRLTDRVAQSDVPVLLLGESGSGKELIARALHRGSERRDRAFVGENCGALPETLLESTLFGHTKGAFTGAHRPRVGLFEAADEGTLLLDEIGEMSLGMQTKLLRVLEDNLVRPVGSTRSRKVDVRVVAATHRNLEEMVERGTFREDLYYRLNVISLRIPPLRERTSDIPLLVQHLIGKHAPKRKIRVTDAAHARLMRGRWAGNVRQLENEVRRALLLADDCIDVGHLTIESDGDLDHGAIGLNVRGRIDALEVELVTEAMTQTGGNQTKAATLLGVSRFGLHKMMKRLGITSPKKSKKRR